MKEAEKKKPIKTVPEHIWEATKPVRTQEEGSLTTDLQGNGYPLVNKQDDKQDQ